MTAVTPRRYIAPLRTAVICAIACAWSAPDAGAETLRITFATTLHAEPGESSKAIAELPRGSEVELVGRSGRWVRVRAGKRVGWVTRTTVSASAAKGSAKRARSRSSEPARETRVDSWRSGRDAHQQATAASEPARERRPGQRGARRAKRRATPRQVAVTEGRATVFRRASGQSAMAFQARERDVMTVLEANTERSWYLVENERGHVGWIPAAAVSAVSSDATRRDRADQGEAARARRRARSRVLRPHITAGVGYRSLSMTFHSNSDAQLGNYLITAQAASATTAIQVPLAPGDSRLAASVEGRYDFTYAAPGVRFQRADGSPEDVAFAMHDADAHAALGYRLLNRQLEVTARAGMRYQVFYVGDLDNAGAMPRESLTGFTAGARAAYTSSDRSYTAWGGAELLAIGSRSQTPGLEDGTDSSARAWWGHAGLDYAVGTRFDATARYTYQRADTDWTGPSTRQADVDGAQRVDTTHAVYLGLGGWF